MGDLLTIDELGELLKRPVGTLRNWRYRNVGPTSFRCGSRILYRRDEVVRWLRQQESNTGRGDDSRVA